MAVKRVFLAIGILCVMVAVITDVWATRQAAVLWEALSSSPTGLAAPTEDQPQVSEVSKSDLASCDTAVTVLACIGWTTIIISLLLMVTEAFRSSRQTGHAKSLASTSEGSASSSDSSD